MEEEDVELKKNVEEEDEEEIDDNDDEEEKAEDVEVDVEEDVEVEKDMEEEDEEELEEDEKEMEDVDVEELEDADDTGKAPQPNGGEEPGTSPLPSTGCMPGCSPPVPGQPGETEASLRALVSQLRAELGQREAASRALASRLAREQRRHRRREEGSARQAQLRAHEAEALRETNTFLGQALAAAVAAGDPGALAQAQEEARVWREVAEERGARLARALAEAAALASQLRDCQAALAAAAGQRDALEDAGAPDEVAAIKEVLQQALELAHAPQEPPPDPQAEGQPGTAASMAMVRTSLRGPYGGAGGPMAGLSSHSPAAPGHPGHRSTGGGPAEPAAAPGPAAGGGTAAGAAQQVGQGPTAPTTPLSHRCRVSPGTRMVPYLDPGEEYLGMGRGKEGRVWGGRAGGRRQFGD